MSEKTKQELLNKIELLRKQILELEKLDAQLRQGKVQVEDLQEHYNDPDGSASELIYHADPQTFEPTYVNSAVESFYGYTEEEWLKDPSLWENLIHPGDKKRILARLRQAKKELKDVVLEYRIIKKDKSIWWVEDHVSWQIDQGGRVVSMDGVVYNITSLKRIEEGLRKAYAQLESESKTRSAQLVRMNEELGRQIAERKHAERQLRKIAKEKAIILDSINELVSYQDKKLRILWANRAAAESVGLDSNKLIGRHCYEIWQQRHRHCTGCPVVRSFKTGKNTQGEMTSPDGRTWLINAYPVKDKDGQILGAVETTMEITETKRVQGLLLDSEKKLRLTFENAKDAIFWADAKTGKIIKCNKAAENLLETRKDDIIGKHQTKLHPPRKSKYYAGMFKKHIAHKGALDAEAEVITKSGKIKPVHITASITLFGKQQIIQGIFRDITERKRVEKELRKSENRYKTLLRNVPQRIFYKDLNSVYVLCNDCYADDLNIKPHEIQGKTDYDFYPNKLAKKYRSDDRSIIKSGRSREIEEKYITHGEELIVHTFKSPLRDEKGNIIGIFGIFWDITESMKVKDKLERLNNELIKSSRRLKQSTLRDAHTGLYNHRFLIEDIEAEFHRAKRYEHSLSIIMLDIDYFKSINDVYGHKFGDLVLKQLARLLKKMVRRYDIVVRFGGEEFLIVSPGTDRSSAFLLAKRISEAVSLYSFGDKKHVVELKLSIAVASYPEDKILKGMDLIETSEKILDRAKERGGNCVYTSLDIRKREPVVEQKDSDLAEVSFLREKIDKLTKKSNQSLIEAVFSFVKTIKLKDRYTGEHVERMVYYATEIANVLNLPRDEIECVKQASVLHDLGKIGIGEKILLKCKRLSKKEFQEIKRHPQIGVDIIRPIQFLHSILPLILYHHEKWDGTGYPKGLKGEEIPVGARIVAVADVYQALISDRPYRKAYSKKEAMKIIKKASGTHFDPKIVDVFLEILKK